MHPRLSLNSSTTQAHAKQLQQPQWWRSDLRPAGRVGAGHYGTSILKNAPAWLQRSACTDGSVAGSCSSVLASSHDPLRSPRPGQAAAPAARSSTSSSHGGHGPHHPPHACASASAATAPAPPFQAARADASYSTDSEQRLQPAGGPVLQERSTGAARGHRREHGLPGSTSSAEDPSKPLSGAVDSSSSSSSSSSAAHDHLKGGRDGIMASHDHSLDSTSSSAPAAARSTDADAPPGRSVREEDEQWMRVALRYAEAAGAAGEVPVGAVIVINGVAVAARHNETSARRSPLAHAEMLAIDAAAQSVGAWRLLGATLYVTVEPCPMCAGAMLQSRIGRVVYGTRQPRVGADGSWVQLLPRQQQQQQQQQVRQGSMSAASSIASSSRSSRSVDRTEEGPVRGACSCGCVDSEGAHAGDDEQPCWCTPCAGASTSSRGARSSCSSSNSSSSKVRGPAVQLGAQHSVDSAGVRGVSEPITPHRPHPFHPNMEVVGGVMEEQARSLLRAFFRRRRNGEGLPPADALSAPDANSGPGNALDRSDIGCGFTQAAELDALIDDEGPAPCWRDPQLGPMHGSMFTPI